LGSCLTAQNFIFIAVRPFFGATGLDGMRTTVRTVYVCPSGLVLNIN